MGMIQISDIRESPRIRTMANKPPSWQRDVMIRWSRLGQMGYMH